MEPARPPRVQVVDHEGMPVPEAVRPGRHGPMPGATVRVPRPEAGVIALDLLRVVPKRHRVVDLLPDRSAPTLADWLRRHRGIRTIARDRSTEYARGIGLGAPRAVQVADRWHLLLSLRQMAERWLAGARGRLRRLPPIPERPPGPARRTSAFPPSRAEQAAGADSRAR